MGSSAPQGGACGYTNEHAGAGSTEPLLFVNATSFGGDGTCDPATTDFTPPVISLVGEDPQVITVGDPYVELGATANDDVDGDLTGSIVIDASGVNTSLTGTYQVTYDVSDTAGNPAVQVVRTVQVDSPSVVGLSVGFDGDDVVDVGDG